MDDSVSLFTQRGFLFYKKTSRAVNGEKFLPDMTTIPCGENGVSPEGNALICIFLSGECKNIPA